MLKDIFELEDPERDWEEESERDKPILTSLTWFLNQFLFIPYLSLAESMRGLFILCRCLCVYILDLAAMTNVHMEFNLNLSYFCTVLPSSGTPHWALSFQASDISMCHGLALQPSQLWKWWCEGDGRVVCWKGKKNLNKTCCPPPQSSPIFNSNPLHLKRPKHSQAPPLSLSLPAELIWYYFWKSVFLRDT